MDNETIALLVIFGFLAMFVLVMVWPHIVHAKVDVDTGVYPTVKDSKGFFHIKGWVKNITHNETNSDISVEMTFAGGHFYKFVLGEVSSTTKTVLLPGQTIAWDHATKAPFAGRPYYNMVVRYNEIPFFPKPVVDVVKPKVLSANFTELLNKL